MQVIYVLSLMFVILGEKQNFGSLGLVEIAWHTIPPKSKGDDVGISQFRGDPGHVFFAGSDKPFLSQSLFMSFFFDVASKTSWIRENGALVTVSAWVLGSHTLLLYSNTTGHLEF